MHHSSCLLNTSCLLCWTMSMPMIKIIVLIFFSLSFSLPFSFSCTQLCLSVIWPAQLVKDVERLIDMRSKQIRLLGTRNKHARVRCVHLNSEMMSKRTAKHGLHVYSMDRKYLYVVIIRSKLRTRNILMWVTPIFWYMWRCTSMTSEIVILVSLF